MTLDTRHFSWGTWRFEKAGPILESQGTREILKKKGKKMLEKGKKRAKYLEIWAKMYKIWEYFEKRQFIACDYRTQ